MTETTPSATGIAENKAAFFHIFQISNSGWPGPSEQKFLQTINPAGDTNQELLPEEAQGLKNLLLSASSRNQYSRFSFFKLKRVVVPPVKIPPELATPNATNIIVAGSRIPMTKDMWTRHRVRMLRRLPRCIDEVDAW
ncbi:hypothetical protein CCR75_007130 [Bremia lactucae]|uniref:Uncharacterized protein n=1 Tax=Bremia lactucae TaxID=4779 RepID=A0A976FGU7_BRELC|nr:hypothetical protein CCR75_007130 [Bremia lactucae]